MSKDDAVDSIAGKEEEFGSCTYLVYWDSFQIKL
jgi:hypothetical protein